jgi:hypothetical protein
MQPFWHMLFPSPTTISNPRASASEQGDSTYGSMGDQDSRHMFTPPYLPGQEQESRTTLGTVPEGMPAADSINFRRGSDNDSTVTSHPVIMLEGQVVHSSTPPLSTLQQGWPQPPQNHNRMSYNPVISTTQPPTSHPFMGISPNFVHQQSQPPPHISPSAEDFSHLLYPQSSFVAGPSRPSPPLIPTSTPNPNNRWSMPTMNPQASQSLTPIWDEDFPWPIAAITTAQQQQSGMVTSSMPSHSMTPPDSMAAHHSQGTMGPYDLPTPSPANLNLALGSHPYSAVEQTYSTSAPMQQGLPLGSTSHNFPAPHEQEHQQEHEHSPTHVGHGMQHFGSLGDQFPAWMLSEEGRGYVLQNAAAVAAGGRTQG